MEIIEIKENNLELFDCVTKSVEQVNYADVKVGDVIIINFKDEKSKIETVYSFYVQSKYEGMKSIKCIGIKNFDWIFEDAKVKLGGTQDCIFKYNKAESEASSNIIQKIRIVSQSDLKESKRITKTSIEQMIDSLPIGTKLFSFSLNILELKEIDKNNLVGKYAFELTIEDDDFCLEPGQKPCVKVKSFRSKNLIDDFSCIAKIDLPNGECVYYNGVTRFLLEAKRLIQNNDNKLDNNKLVTSQSLIGELGFDPNKKNVSGELDEIICQFQDAILAEYNNMIGGTIVEPMAAVGITMTLLSLIDEAESDIESETMEKITSSPNLEELLKFICEKYIKYCFPDGKLPEGEGIKFQVDKLREIFQNNALGGFVGL